jgi:hypothetical protein
MSTARAALHAPFRSRRGRAVTRVGAVAQAVVLVAAAAVLPWSGPAQVGWLDRVGFVVVAAVIGWFLLRLGGVAATPSETGLVVRNILLTRRLAWTEVLQVRFGPGDPWVTLEVADGDTLAVMAIQRADGEAGRLEAGRLATLVALHHPDRP